MKGSKTFIFALAILLLGILESTPFNDFLKQVDLNGNGTVTAAIGFFVMVLRLYTTTPIFQKTDTDQPPVQAPPPSLKG